MQDDDETDVERADEDMVDDGADVLHVPALGENVLGSRVGLTLFAPRDEVAPFGTG